MAEELEAYDVEILDGANVKRVLPYILAAQAQKHVTHNEALRILDGLV